MSDEPILTACPYCGNETESINEKGKVVCGKCGKTNPNIYKYKRNFKK